jgi:putative acetyltransferase
MKIRCANINDTVKIAQTHKASIQELCKDHYKKEDIAGWLNIISPNTYENAIKENVFIVVKESDKILGLGILDLSNSEIKAVYVHPNSIKQGIGKKILSKLEKTASKNNINQLTLCSTLSAVNFYKHQGYTEESKTFHELSNGIKLECIKMNKTLRKII